MSRKFRNKFRIGSARLQTWDYRWNAAYFITICTQNRKHYFGEINNGKMLLSKAGIIADMLWLEIKNHSKYIELGSFVVMPNHIHGILIIDRPGQEQEDNYSWQDAADKKENLVDTRQNPIDIGENTFDPRHALYQPKTPGQQRFQNQGKNSVSSIIGSYKSAVSKHTNRLEIEFGWQNSFHDHIIRNQAAYKRISLYIEKNPQNWPDK